MQPVIETAFAASLALAGTLAGRWFSRRPGPSWTLGYFIPMSLVAAFLAAQWFPALEFSPPICWLLAGRTEFALAALIGPMILTTPLSRVPRPETRRLVCLFAAILTTPSLWLFLAPALNHDLQRSLRTVVDHDGICIQGTDYNCGPAAAVTALLRLGLPADEGEIAILARTTSAAGTPPDLLAQALEWRYPPSQLHAQYRHFNSLEDLPPDAITVAVIKFGLFVDHYVTILEVSDTELTIGDPLKGLLHMSREEFLKEWRCRGIVLRRT